MASGPEHFKESEKYLHRLATQEHPVGEAITIAVAAIAHATLAQAAAIALQAPVAMGQGIIPAGLPEDLYNEWNRVAGADD